MSRYWMLPEDMIELLPDNAALVEKVRREFLDNVATWGYRLVIPPLAEFLDSLLAGSENLDLQTFKITDQQSGRMMGVRADITPQIARIDAHRLPTDAVSRFAYCGEVLRTRSESIQPRRNPLIAGAELYGVASVSGDIEIMALLLDCIERFAIEDSVLDIGHSGIFSGLVELYQLNSEQRRQLKSALSGLQRPELALWAESAIYSPDYLEDVQFLLDAPLNSGDLKAFKARFYHRHPLFNRAIDELEAAFSTLSDFFPQQNLKIDFASVGNYGYHSGLLFALYAQGHYDAIARGGRYDGLGEVYGRARAATGFSIDLLTLCQLLSPVSMSLVEMTPLPQTAQAFAEIKRQRRQGKQVSFQHRDE